MILAQILVVLSGVWLIGIGILMFVSPGIATEYLKKFASTNFINYTELIIRGIWGITLICVSELSKYPRFNYFFGIMLTATALVLLFVPRRLHSKYAVWWADRITATYMKAAALVSFSFGIFLIYSII